MWTSLPNDGVLPIRRSLPHFYKLQRSHAPNYIIVGCSIMNAKFIGIMLLVNFISDEHKIRMSDLKNMR